MSQNLSKIVVFNNGLERLRINLTIKDIIFGHIDSCTFGLYIVYLMTNALGVIFISFKTTLQAAIHIGKTVQGLTENFICTTKFIFIIKHKRVYRMAEFYSFFK